MIGFQDFAPRQTRPAGFLTNAEYENIIDALNAANDWITANGVKVLNVETVALPNIWRPGEMGTGDGSLPSDGQSHSNWYQFIRVWYESSDR
jgi:hypothetical protein